MPYNKNDYQYRLYMKVIIITFIKNVNYFLRTYIINILSHLKTMNYNLITHKINQTIDIK